MNTSITQPDPASPEKTVTMITKNLYLGGWLAAQDVAFLKAKNITLVINCTKHIADIPVPGVTHYRIPTDDAEILDLEQPENLIWNTYAPNAIDIMMQHMAAGNSVLVHCHRGVQRSASVVVAFLCRVMGYQKKDIGDVAKFVMSKRPCVFNYGANFNFYLSVVYYTTVI